MQNICFIIFFLSLSFSDCFSASFGSALELLVDELKQIPLGFSELRAIRVIYLPLNPTDLFIQSLPQSLNDIDREINTENSPDILKEIMLGKEMDKVD